MKSKFAVFAALALTWGVTARAQGQRVSLDAALHSSDRPYVEANGQAALSAKPDQAVITIGVISQASSTAAAAAENAKQTAALVADLRKILAADRLKTTSYLVRPVYQAPKPGTTPVITAYTATNVVEATLDDLSQVGKVIDIATQSGANNIRGLEFKLKNMQQMHSQALREAASQAKSNADAIAAGLGVHVLRVISAEESLPGEDFVYSKKATPPPPVGAPVSTPIEISSIEVSASVTLRVEIAP